MTQENRDAAFLIKLIHDSIEKRANKDLSRYNITIAQERVLMFLCEHADEAMTQRDIEEYLGVSHPTVVGIIQRLESKGLIRCEPNKYDKRMKNIYLTNLQNDILPEFLLSRKKYEERLLADFSAEEKEVLKSLLCKAYKNIK